MIVVIIALVAANVYTLRQLLIWRERAWRALDHAKKTLSLNDTLLKERDAARLDAEFAETKLNVLSAVSQHAKD